MQHQANTFKASDIAARRANVLESIAAARNEPELAGLWNRCIRIALADYRAAQAQPA